MCGCFWPSPDPHDRPDTKVDAFFMLLFHVTAVAFETLITGSIVAIFVYVLKTPSPLGCEAYSTFASVCVGILFSCLVIGGISAAVWFHGKGLRIVIRRLREPN